MKKQIFNLTLCLVSLVLTSCGETSTSFATTTSYESSSSSSSSSTSSVDPNKTKFESVILSLKERSHTATIHYKVGVYKTDGSLSLEMSYDYIYNYMYGDEVGFSMQGSRTSQDLMYDSTTGEYLNYMYLTNSSGEKEKYVFTPRVTQIPLESYFRDEDTGVALFERLNADNTITTYIASDEDYYTGMYTAINFDLEFVNPWDYITTDDLTYVDDKTYILSPAKGKFVANAYNVGTTTNYIRQTTIHTDDSYNVSSLEFEIDDEVGNNYTRKNEFTISYSNVDNVKVKHKKVATNSNPELEALFNKFKESKNFTYAKKYYTTTEDTSVFADTVTGYYTENDIFFHHDFNGLYDDKMNTSKNDYDYRVTLNSSDNKYYAYEYNSNDGTQFYWGLVTVSNSAYLSYDNFSDIGPNFYDLSPSLFIKNDDDNSYTIVEDFEDEVGTYFDNQFDGVHTDYFDGATSSFKLTLTNDGFNVETSYTASSIEYRVDFTLSNIGTTSLPSYYLETLN